MTSPLLRRLLIAALLLSSSLQACGDNTPGNVQVEPEPEALSDPEPTQQPEPEFVERVPGFVEVSGEPLRHVYAPGVLLLPTASVFDQFGAPLDAEVAFTVEPEAMAELQDTGRFELATEGNGELVGCARGADGAQVCGRYGFVVDEVGPTIEITEPAAGAMLLASEHPAVTVSGRVIDTHGELRVFVDGQQVPLDDEGGFDAEIQPRFGINHVEVIASDGLQAVETTSGVDFMWAQGYHPATGGERSAVSFEEGAALRIGREFFDDGQPLILPPERGTVQTDDLAGILELLIHEIDIMSQIPDPLTDSDVLSLRITSVDLGNVRVEVDVVEGGLEIYIQLAGLRATTAGQFSFEGAQFDLGGAIEATASAFTKLTMSKPERGAAYNIDLIDLELAIERAESQFASPEANAIFALAQSALRGVLEDAILGALAGSFIDELPDTLLSVFSTLEGALSGLSFDLDTGLGPAISLSLNAEVTTLTPRAGSDISASLAIDVSASAAPHFTESRGVPLAAPIDSTAPFFRSSPLQIGVRLGVFNGLMHALWDAGVLEINVFDILPPELGFLLESAVISAKLPPTVTVPLPDEGTTDLLITLGQLEMVADFGDQVDVFGFNISVGANVDVTGGAISLSINPEPRIRAWVISTTGQRPGFDAASLRSILLTQLWPRLEGLLDTTLSIPLPTVDLGAVGELAPTLSDMTIDTVLTRPMDVRGGFLIFDGVWRGTAELQ